jgi:hypothetical protein
MKTERVVKLQVKHSYGQKRIYPKNQAARLLCALTGRVTFLQTDLPNIVALDYDIEWVPEELASSSR